MLLRKYEMPWRRAYEAYAGLAWAFAFVFFVFAVVRSVVPWPLTAGLALFCMMLAFRRCGQALDVLTVRASLCGRAMHSSRPAGCASSELIQSRSSSGSASNGSRCTRSVSTSSPRSTSATSWCPPGSCACSATRSTRSRRRMGLPYIHGVEPRALAVSAAAQLRGRHEHRRHHPVRQGRDPVGARRPRRSTAATSSSSSTPRTPSVSRATSLARLPGRRARRRLRRIPPGVSRTGHPFRSHVQLAEAHRARLAHPVGHAARHQRQLLRVRLGRRQRRGAGHGRSRGSSQPEQARAVHRGWHRAGPAALAATPSSPTLARPTGGICVKP